MFATYEFSIAERTQYAVEIYLEFEIYVRGHCMSRAIMPLDTSCMISYRPSVVTLAVSCFV